MSKEDKENQLDLFEFDPKEKKVSEEQQKNAKAEFRKKVNKLRKASDLRKQKIDLEQSMKESVEELREWELLKYIKDNYKKIIITEMEVIEHKQSSKGIYKSKKGFIDFVVPYPIFPHKDDDELELAKEALIWFQDTLDIFLYERELTTKFINCIGGIRAKDAYTFDGKVIEDVGCIGEFNESKYFTDLYVFDDEESGYVYDKLYYDMELQLTETGLHFKWEYPEYFQILEDDFDKFAKRLWDELLDVSEVWHA